MQSTLQSAEGEVLLKNSYSSSFVSCLLIIKEHEGQEKGRRKKERTAEGGLQDRLCSRIGWLYGLTL
jgi:hypothetical protein